MKWIPNWVWTVMGFIVCVFIIGLLSIWPPSSPTLPPPTIEPISTQEPDSSDTPIPIALPFTTSTPTITPASITKTATYTPIPTTQVPSHLNSPTSSRCDDFDSATLSSGWNWIDPREDSAYSLTDKPGFLRITVYGKNHDLYKNLNAPRMLQSIDGNFVVTTKVTIVPKANYQGAGLLFWQDEDNYVRLERTLVKGIDLLYRIQGIYRAVEIPFSSPTVFLKYEYANQSLQEFYSEDGVNWVSVKTLQLPLSDNNQVGVVVVNEWQDGSISVDFDYFRFSECQ